MAVTIFADSKASPWIEDLLFQDCHLSTYTDSTDLESKLSQLPAFKKAVISCLGTESTEEAESFAKAILTAVHSNPNIQYVICFPCQGNESFDTIRQMVSESNATNVQISYSFRDWYLQREDIGLMEVDKKHAEYLIAIAKGEDSELGYGNSTISSKKKPKKLFLVLSSIILVLISVTAVYVLRNQTHEDNRLSNQTNEDHRFGNNRLSNQTYEDDGFVRMLLSNNSDGVVQYIDVKTLDGTKLTFEGAEEKCSNLSSSLWSIRYGEDEWKPVIAHLLSKNITDPFWLAGSPGENCTKKDIACKEEEAKGGKGLKMNWSDGCEKDDDNFSRLVDSHFKCVVADDKEPNIWKTVLCEGQLYSAVCVTYSTESVMPDGSLKITPMECKKTSNKAHKEQ